MAFLKVKETSSGLLVVRKGACEYTVITSTIGNRQRFLQQCISLHPIGLGIFAKKTVLSVKSTGNLNLPI